MADNCGICLLGAMDRLWFYQIILFSERPSLISPKICTTPLPFLESSSLSYASSTNPSTLFPEDQQAPSVPSQGDSYNEQSEDEADKKRSRNPRKLGNSRRRLQKIKSCKSLLELELEELEGFMDLGFKFSKENLTPRMMSIIPGLQRLEEYKYDKKVVLMMSTTAADEVVSTYNYDDVNEKQSDEVENRYVKRPYLSEAWLIKRPDSPLLNLRIRRVSATSADMKKHLKYWARTVASVIQQES